MDFNIINFLVFDSFRKTESLKDIAPLQLLGSQDPMMSFLVTKKIADKVIELEEDLAAEKAKCSVKPNVIYQGPITLTADMISRLTESQIGQLSGQLGAHFDTNRNKSENAADLVAAFAP